MMRVPNRRLWHPEWFHGVQRGRTFFEGWYYKLVDASRQQSLAVIPGVYGDGREAHAFVQLLHGPSGLARYVRYPLSSFSCPDDAMDVRIGPNRSRLDRLELAIDDPALPLSGTVELGAASGWPVTLSSPGAMGPFAFLPAMQCYHGVLKMDAALDGRLRIGADDVSFAEGRGYMEKDWGRAFPSAWVWMQCNHFSQPLSLMVSIARVPFLGASFQGFLACLQWQGQLIRFAPYLVSRLDGLRIDDETVSFALIERPRADRPRLRLQVTARQGQTGVLQAPTAEGMAPRDPEGLGARLDLILSEQRRGGWSTVFSGRGEPAALEFGGTVEELL